MYISTTRDGRLHMEITCTDKKLNEELSDEKKLKGRYKQSVFKAIKRKIGILKASETLADYRKHDIRLELLMGGAAKYSIHLNANWRLIFTPKEPIPRYLDGGIDEKKVKEIVLVEIVDYH